MSPEVWKGYYKLVEEMGECLTVLGKLGAFPSGEHPDGGGPLQARLLSELADVRAALQYFETMNFTLEECCALDARIVEKMSKFNLWGLSGLVTRAPEERYGDPGPEGS